MLDALKDSPSSLTPRGVAEAFVVTTAPPSLSLCLNLLLHPRQRLNLGVPVSLLHASVCLSVFAWEPETSIRPESREAGTDDMASRSQRKPYHQDPVFTGRDM